jgi:hypothetical protein
MDCSSPHTPYSPDLAPSCLNLFGALKIAIRRKRFGSDDEVIEEMAASSGVRLLQDRDTRSFFRWRKAVEVDRAYIEKWGV